MPIDCTGHRPLIGSQSLCRTGCGSPEVCRARRRFRRHALGMPRGGVGATMRSVPKKRGAPFAAGPNSLAIGQRISGNSRQIASNSPRPKKPYIVLRNSNGCADIAIAKIERVCGLFRLGNCCVRALNDPAGRSQAGKTPQKVGDIPCDCGTPLVVSTRSSARRYRETTARNWM